MVQTYRDLIAWQKAMALVSSVYKLSAEFPRDEVYALTQQIRRAAVSVPSNIAEGQARRSSKEFMRFLSTAMGSLAEVETQILLAEQLSYVDHARVGPVLHECSATYMVINRLYAAIDERSRAAAARSQTESRTTDHGSRKTKL